MINVTLGYDDLQEKQLEQFAAASGKLEDKVLLSVAGKLSQYVKRSFLSGQMLGVRTGTARSRVRARMSRRGRHIAVVYGGGLANIYEHPGGVNIAPRKKRALRWVNERGEWKSAMHVHLGQKPFMSTAASSFNFGTATDESVDKFYGLELQKRGLK